MDLGASDRWSKSHWPFGGRVRLPGSGDNHRPASEVTLDAYATRLCEVLASRTEAAIMTGNITGGIVRHMGFTLIHRALRCGGRVEGSSPIGLAAASGCRRGELLAIQWTDLDFDTGLLVVSKSLEQTKAGLGVKSTNSGETVSAMLACRPFGRAKCRKHKEEVGGDDGARTRE
jgi:hypothetical protein